MRLISYLRVSTARQGASGLGLEAQRAAVTAYTVAGNHVLAAEHVEVESGAKAARPELAAALAACQLHRATLVIAKLDRLARNVAFIANLMDGGVDFVACDMPHANRLTLHLFAAIAEHEREAISQRTKAALQAAKARGVVLGNPNGAAALSRASRTGALESGRRRQARTRHFDEVIQGVLAGMRETGIAGARALTLAMNERAIPSPTGLAWHEVQVRRVLQRLAAR